MSRQTIGLLCELMAFGVVAIAVPWPDALLVGALMAIGMELRRKEI